MPQLDLTFAKFFNQGIKDVTYYFDQFGILVFYICPIK